MNIPAPRGNWWTPQMLVSYATLISMVIGGLFVWFTLLADVGMLKEWKVTHEGEVKERMQENVAAQAALDARADTGEKADGAMTNRIDGLGYRISALESKAPQIDGALAALQQSMSDQSGDLKVIREILTRIEKGEGAGR